MSWPLAPRTGARTAEPAGRICTTPPEQGDDGTIGLVPIRATDHDPQHCWDRKEPLVRMGLIEVEDEPQW